MKRFAMFLTFAALTACSPELNVFSDMDPDYDLAAYKTFGWAERLNSEFEKYPLRYNELNDKRIKTAVEKQMQSRGYVADSGHPDVLIRYHIVVDETTLLAPEPYGYVYGPFWMRADIHAYYYREGTLIIDLVDNSTRQLIWRGWATGDADEIKPSQVDRMIQVAVKKIFRKFPATKHNQAPSKDLVSK